MESLFSFSDLSKNVMFALIIPMMNIAVGALQFKYFLNALFHFILHQPSEVICMFITLIL